MKRVIVIGSEGQDGRILVEVLKKESIPCLRIHRNGAIDSEGKSIPFGGPQDAERTAALVRDFAPTHVYYLAAYHHSSQDKITADNLTIWDKSYSVQVQGLLAFLEAIRVHAPTCRLFYAASSHVFGSNAESPQTETTAFAPETIYAVTKLTGLYACRQYRKQYGLFASVGILYNHESIYRRREFLSQKIIQGALDIKQGRKKTLVLGNLSASADWGYAPDYVDAMIRIAGHSTSGDYIVATGKLHTVKEFATLVFEQLGLNPDDHVQEDASLLSRASIPLCGDSSRLKKDTQWQPTISFQDMVRQLTMASHRLETDISHP